MDKKHAGGLDAKGGNARKEEDSTSGSADKGLPCTLYNVCHYEIKRYTI